jgi:hypothetical protein
MTRNRAVYDRQIDSAPGEATTIDRLTLQATVEPPNQTTVRNTSVSQATKRAAGQQVQENSLAAPPAKKPRLTPEEIRQNKTRKNNQKIKEKLYDLEKCSKVWATITLAQRQRVLGGLKFSFVDDISEQMELLKASEKAEDRDLYAIWERALFYYRREYNITQKIIGQPEVDMGKN